MVRSWNTLVGNSCRLWRAIPQAGSAEPQVGVLDQIQAHVQALGRDARALHARRTGQRLEPDRDLEAIGSLMVRAAEAIENSNVRKLPTPDHLRDAFATRVQVTHVVYLTGHATTVGLRRHSPVDEDFRRRMEIPTSLALGYHESSYPEALTETHRDWSDPDRLGSNVSAFDIHAHRVLTSEPTARDLRDVAATMHVTTTYARALWRIAADAGHIDAREHRTQLDPALEHAGNSWLSLASTWDVLTHPVQGRAGALQHASVDLRTSFGELTKDRLGPATPEVITARTDMGAALAALRQYHLSAVGIADAFVTATRNPGLVVDARGASRMIATMIEQGRVPDPRSTPVSPRSVQLRRPVPLPRVLMQSTALEAEGPLRAARQLDQAVSTIAGRPNYCASSVIERIGPRPDPGRLRLVREQARYGQGTTNCTPPAGPVSRTAP
ncbi:hypothetical protein [uncultured Serinicoccus sp.]|uniref:hypothetical protein n=1 Tax=uncultured Serinicoccus sp. TaxID=735514 RepID=UPI00262201A0|nr:hypothetical protein [uncultured Serinicoccus sp.]